MLKPIVKTLSNAAKYTKHMLPSDPAWQAALKRAPTTLTGKLLVGGTLLNISGPLYAEHGEIYADMPPEYHYNLTFRGKDKNPTFHFYSLEPIKIPLVEGHFYKFDLPKAFGLVGSSGPHSSMFAAEDLGNFVEVTC